MGIDKLMTDGTGREIKVVWQQRDHRSVPEVARERISRYFAECPKGNVPSVFVRYRLSQEKLGWWDRLWRRNYVFDEQIFPGENEKEIRTSLFDILDEKPPINLDDYLMHAQWVCLTFMFGTRYNHNCVVEWNGGSSRVGEIPSRTA